MATGAIDQILANTLPAIYILNLTTFAQKHGKDPDELLQSSGLTEEGLSKPDRRIPAIQAMQIYMALVAAIPQDNLGMLLGLGSRITNLGLVGFGMMSCANMREASLLNIRHLPILAPMMRLTLEESGGGSSLHSRLHSRSGAAAAAYPRPVHVRGHHQHPVHDA